MHTQLSCSFIETQNCHCARLGDTPLVVLSTCQIALVDFDFYAYIITASKSVVSHNRTIDVNKASSVKITKLKVHPRTMVTIKH